MNWLKIYIFLAFGLLNLYANKQKFGVFSMKSFLLETNRSVLEKMNKEVFGKQEAFRKLYTENSQKVSALNQEIEKKKGIIKKSTLDQKKMMVKVLMEETKTAQMKLNITTKDIEKKYLSKILEKANDIIKNKAKSKNIDLVFNGDSMNVNPFIFYAKGGLYDLTDEVIAVYKSKVKLKKP